MNNILSYSQRKLSSNYRYGVYKHRLITKDGLVFIKSLIVIKNQYGVIVHFTRLHKYIESSGVSNVCKLITSDNRAKLHYICLMLNYVLVDNHTRFKINHIFKISKHCLDIFIQEYALSKQPNGKYRSRQSVEKCINALTNFFTGMIKEHNGYMALNQHELHCEKIMYKKHGKNEKKHYPNFQVKVMPRHNTIFRDIPTKVFEILLNQSFVYAKDIAFAICLQAFAGLRAGEALSVRQEHSPLGSGITLTINENSLCKVEIDLTNEYVLRSDGVISGRIKKERVQQVHPAFLNAFNMVYKFHKQYLSEQKYEEQYCPMFINKLNMAMTYDDYYRRFKNLIVKHLRPFLLDHKDAECRLYGQLLYEHSLGLHSLRHWFSVQLVLMGEDIAQIQYWRGDANPESALYYLQDKGDLAKELALTNEKFASLLLNRGGTYDK